MDEKCLYCELNERLSKIFRDKKEQNLSNEEVIDRIINAKEIFDSKRDLETAELIEKVPKLRKILSGF